MDLNFLKNYMNTFSPVGMEYLSQQLWIDQISDCVDQIYDDNYGSIISVINPDAEYKVLLDSHSDSVCFYVNTVDKDGNISVKRNGSSDSQISFSKDVVILTSNGTKIEGVFGSVPIHLQKQSDTKVKVDKLWIDVGCSTKEEVEKLGIEIGNVAYYPDKFKILNRNKLVAQSFDDKIGNFIMTEVLRRLKENEIKLPFGLYVVNSVMEEVGLHGSKQVSAKIKPDVAICFDPTHATNIPSVDSKENGEFKLGDGVVFSISPAIHSNLNKLMIETAKENSIKYKVDIRERGTGTNADSYAFPNAAITGLVSIPLKYMHTTVEMIQMSDVENAIELIYRTLLKIENNHDFRYLKLKK